MSTRAGRLGMGRRAPAAVWSMFALCWVAVFVTYSRFPADQLYNVSGTGLRGGASRLLVYLNFPTSLAVIAVVAVSYERLATPLRKGLAAVAVLLCTPVFWPGVVSQSDLDARPINVVAAVGVALALGLTFGVRVTPARTRRGDQARLVVAAVVVLAAPEWVAAELGFFLNRVPLFGRVYLSGRYLPRQPGLPAFPPAVHHGDHHGLNGVLLVLTALLLSRLLPGIARRGLRRITAAYLSLMLVYGLGNIANDFWIEQINKRGVTRWTWPSVLEPRIDWAWFTLIALAALVWCTWFRSDDALEMPAS